MLASLGGILLSFREPSVVFSNFNSFDATGYVPDSVIGGVGYVNGPLVGGVLQVGGLGTNIGNLFGSSVQNYLPLIGGVALMLILIKDPDGAAASMAQNVSTVKRLLKRGRTEDDTNEPEEMRSGLVGRSGSSAEKFRRAPATLAARNVSVRFGATYALREVTLEVRPGEVVGLIGPNGSGKTTLMDAMTGFVSLAGGSVEFDGRNIKGWDARKRGSVGIA